MHPGQAMQQLQAQQQQQQQQGQQQQPQVQQQKQQQGAATGQQQDSRSVALVATDVCLKALQKDILPLGPSLLIQYDLPSSKVSDTFNINESFIHVHQ
jgi:hypothetical protein